jgi:hypothetical protein
MIKEEKEQTITETSFEEIISETDSLSPSKTDTNSIQSIEDDSKQQQIDQKLFEILTLMDEVKLFQNQAHKLLKAGFFDLAQAKYQMGPQNITQNQYDARMIAETKLVDNELVVGNNAIKWFGVLVPNCLRRSQNEFINSLKSLVEIKKLVDKIDGANSELELLVGEQCK